MSLRPSALEVAARVLDPGSFMSWDTPIAVSHHSPGYQDELRWAASTAATDESILTGRGTVEGRAVAVILNEFRFLGGSIGAGAADRIVAAVRRATAERLPLLAATASGGTRMQEGTPAFLRMVDISRAIIAHRSAGLPYLVFLRHPTTGGVYASWGSLGQLTVGEPGALIGFLGPKVYAALHGEPFPAGVQLAETLARTGVIDAVTSPEDLRNQLTRALRVLTDPPQPPQLPRRRDEPDDGLDAWEAITSTRARDRIGVRDLLRHGGRDTVRMAGTGTGERDDAVILALTRLDGQPCVVAGQDRSRQQAGAALGPPALRAARRAMGVAEELRLPLVTVVDTPGADLSPAAEKGALAGEIARCMTRLIGLRVPTVTVLLGQGCGGGALALLPSAYVVAAERAWLSPLPPEGASVILHGTTARAAELARAQNVRAVDLRRHGAVDVVVAEHPGDAKESFVKAIVAEVSHHLFRRTRGDQEGVPCGPNRWAWQH